MRVSEIVSEEKENLGLRPSFGFYGGGRSDSRDDKAETGTDRRDRHNKPQTLCLPSLCIPLLLCCSDGFKNNWECPRGLRLWDKSDPPAAREKFTKYPWLKIIP